MDKYCRHQKVYSDGKSECYLFTWSIPEVSMINNLELKTNIYKMPNGTTYYAYLCGSKDKIAFTIHSNSKQLKCCTSMVIGSKTLFLSKSVDSFTKLCNNFYLYDMFTLSSQDESFQNLNKDPNNTLTFICKIKHPGSISTGVDNSRTDNSSHLRSLADILRNSSKSLLKETVLLKVGEESQTASKAVLSAMSPVFAKMFESDMKEGQENVVNIVDIKMPVLKVLISFLYTGKLSNCDFDLLCDLYYAADKYDVANLRKICADSIIPQISMGNIHRVMKLAFTHDDELLKSTVLALIATNIEAWFSTNDWINLVNDDPEIAAEVLNFFDF